MSAIVIRPHPTRPDRRRTQVLFRLTHITPSGAFDLTLRSARELRDADDAYLPLVDQHCHAIRLDELDTGAFEALCSESPYPAGNGSHLDGPVGFAIRRWCPPVLDLEPFCSWDIYLARRAQLGAVEVSRRLLRAAGHELLLVDTGYRGDELCSLADLSTLAGTPTREIVRIEVVAEELAEAMRAVDAADDLRAEDFLASFERRLRERCATAVGMKSILAYRCGFDLDGVPCHGGVSLMVDRRPPGRPKDAVAPSGGSERSERGGFTE